MKIPDKNLVWVHNLKVTMQTTHENLELKNYLRCYTDDPKITVISSGINSMSSNDIKWKQSNKNTFD